MRQENTPHRKSNIPNIEIIDLDLVPAEENPYDEPDDIYAEDISRDDSENAYAEDFSGDDSENAYAEDFSGDDSENAYAEDFSQDVTENAYAEDFSEDDSENAYAEDFSWDDTEDTSAKDDLPGRSKSSVYRTIWHVAFVLTLALCVGLIYFRFANWGVRVPSLFDPDAEYDDSEFIEVLDHMMNVPADQRQDTDGIRTVVLLGNSPFADERDSEDSVASLIGQMTDATIYNCSVAGSHLAAAKETFIADEDPMDAFNLYWLSTLLTLQNTSIYESAFAAMGDAAPADALYAYETLSTLDFQNVDVLAIMYDASDYLEERPLYNVLNTTDIQTFAGNMDASLDLLCSAFPHLRIIVMSPTYAYYVDENGQYISSDIHKSTGYSLSTYAGNLEQISYYHSVSYLDNIYGTVNEDNAGEYLSDHLHLNAAGRRRLAERFVYALEYFD